MASSADWRQLDGARRHAAREGEETAEAYCFREPPVDPLQIIRAERHLIHAVGRDFGSAFDGRIRYVGPRFLLCYNTRYDNWPHAGRHHSKVLFTIAHELGHYFLEAHRRSLVALRGAHGSRTEFISPLLIEQQADHFASGLLMPSSLFRSRVNRSNFPSLADIKQVRKDFQVSLTGVLVRWTQLCDFPCAAIAVHNGRMQFGWVSSALRRIGAFQIRRGDPMIGRDAVAFANRDPEVRGYCDGCGSGAVKSWIDFDLARLVTVEYYFAIPHTKAIWVFLLVDEDDLPESVLD